MFVGKSFEEGVCPSRRQYLVTRSIQLDTNAAQLSNYTSRIELVGSDNFERSELVVRLLHPTSTIKTVLGFSGRRAPRPSSNSSVQIGAKDWTNGDAALEYLSGQSDVANSSRVYSTPSFSLKACAAAS